MNRTRIAVVVGWLAFAFPLVLDAQTPDPSTLSDAQRAELGELFTEARAAYEAGDWLASIAPLTRAYSIFPDPDILYRIGEAYESAGELERAVVYYERYLGDAVDASDRGLVGRRIADLRRRIAEAREPSDDPRSFLVLDTEPVGASIIVDGEPAEGTTPTRIEVSRGTHSVSLVKEGYVTVEREVDIESGETISFVYRLDRIVVETPAPPAPRWPLWVGVGGGTLLAGAATSFAVAGIAEGKVRAWDDERERAYDAGEVPPRRPPAYDVTARRAGTARTVGIVAASVGGVMLGTAIVGALAKGGETTAEVGIGPGSFVVRYQF